MYKFLMSKKFELAILVWLVGLLFLLFHDDIWSLGKPIQQSLSYYQNLLIQDEELSSADRFKDSSLNKTELENLYKTAFRTEPGVMRKTIHYGVKNIFGNKTFINNPHVYKFLLRPDVKECRPMDTYKKKKIRLVAIVMISAEYFKKRMVIRASWGNASLLDDPLYDLKVFFAVGWWSKDVNVNEKLKREAKIYNDIIQEDFVEDYFNITIKVIGSFKFIAEYCPNTDFVLRINDDMVPNMRHLIDFLSKIKTDNGGLAQNMIMGNIMPQSTPYRSPSKWYVNESQFEGDRYLPYMEGSAFIVTTDLAINMYYQSRYVYWPPFSISLEDVYIGMLLMHFQSDFYQLNSRITSGMPYKRFTEQSDDLINRVGNEFYSEIPINKKLLSRLDRID